MKALSIQQPWAWLITHAHEYPDPKRIENRTWSTKHRGDTLIHAGKKFDRDGYSSLKIRRPDLRTIMPQPGEFDLGGIVGVAKLVDCIEVSADWWFNGDYGFVFAKAMPLPFAPYRGQLGFFDVTVSGLQARIGQVAPSLL